MQYETRILLRPTLNKIIKDICDYRSKSANIFIPTPVHFPVLGEHSRHTYNEIRLAQCRWINYTLCSQVFLKEYLPTLLLQEIANLVQLYVRYELQCNELSACLPMPCHMNSCDRMVIPLHRNDGKESFSLQFLFRFLVQFVYDVPLVYSKYE